MQISRAHGTSVCQTLAFEMSFNAFSPGQKRRLRPAVASTDSADTSKKGALQTDIQITIGWSAEELCLRNIQS